MYAEHFSIENIPFGIGSTATHPSKSVVTRLEDTVIFLDELSKHGLLSDLPEETIRTFSEPTVNAYAALPKPQHLLTRSTLQTLLRTGLSSLPPSSLTPINTATLHLPLSIGDFSDYSCSLNHVLNAGEAIQGKREAPPAFEYYPVGYTARTSSIVVSGTDIVRPKGQYRDAEGKVVFGATRRLDYEVEVAAVVGKASRLGEGVDIKDADEYIFGLVLLNDWSARDIQALEMPPLGPLNGKSFSTQISPWIIPLEALSPFRAPPPPRNPSIPLASYLQDPSPLPTYAFSLIATVQPANAPSPTIICETNFSSLYWTLRDLVAHQTVNGCNLNVGDLLATGTISGETGESHGCLLEMVKKGGVGVKIEGGEEVKRVFFEDGDTVRISAVAGKGVGFGECVGRVLPARV